MSLDLNSLIPNLFFGINPILPIIASIRAFGAQDRFSQDSLRYIDGYTRPARVFYNLNRWLNIRIGFMSAAFSACLATYVVYFHELSAGNTGFSLNMAGKSEL